MLKLMVIYTSLCKCYASSPFIVDFDVTELVIITYLPVTTILRAGNSDICDLCAVGVNKQLCPTHSIGFQLRGAPCHEGVRRRLQAMRLPIGYNPKNKTMNA